MKVVKLNPMEHPRKKGESWWIVHPNNPKSEFLLPVGAVTACQKTLECFQAGKVYRVESSPDQGWVRAYHSDMIYEMPQYLFARYFDAEAFVRGILTENEKAKLETAVPYPYKPTLPPPPRKQMVFEDILGEKNK